MSKHRTAPPSAWIERHLGQMGPRLVASLSGATTVGAMSGVAAVSKRFGDDRRSAPIALILVAAVVLSATICCQVASARLPEWGICHQLPAHSGGRYLDAGCLAVASSRKLGSYEWTPVAAGGHVRLFPMTMSGTFEIQTGAGKTITCTRLGTEGNARVSGSRGVATPLWELDGCASEERECRSGLTALLGEINNTFSWLEEAVEAGAPPPGWDGRLGFVAKHTDPPTVGILYTVRNKGRLFVPVACSAQIGTVWVGGDPKGKDSFISTIAPVDRMTEEFTETFSQSSPGQQLPQSLEGHTARTIMAFLENHWEPVALDATFHFRVETSLGSLEIKASR